MRLLADANIARSVVEALRAEAHDVVWLVERQAALSDAQVLEIAVAERRFVLTRDKDFGALTHQREPVGVPGVILLRLALPPGELASTVAAALRNGSDWTGCFVVVEADRLRIRTLR